MKTYQQTLFNDDDLRKPKHDEIMMWIDNNALQFIKMFVDRWRA
jgi:hypothetical protein